MSRHSGASIGGADRLDALWALRCRGLAGIRHWHDDHDRALPEHRPGHLENHISRQSTKVASPAVGTTAAAFGSKQKSPERPTLGRKAELPLCRPTDTRAFGSIEAALHHCESAHRSVLRNRRRRQINRNGDGRQRQSGDSENHRRNGAIAAVCIPYSHSIVPGGLLVTS